MSYDFTPTHHIGMTPEGYYIGGHRTRRTAKPAPKRTGPYVKYTDGALRLECAKGVADAIAEYEYRLNTHTYY